MSNYFYLTCNNEKYEQKIQSREQCRKRGNKKRKGHSSSLFYTKKGDVLYEERERERRTVLIVLQEEKFTQILFAVSPRDLP